MTICHKSAKIGVSGTKKKKTIACLGWPNTGKSSLVRYLSKTNVQTSNWEGTTVTPSHGHVIPGTDLVFFDLPGTFSLSDAWPESRNYVDSVIEGRYSCQLNIIDSLQLKNQLYLTIQLMELGLPTVLVLNMTDLLDERGITIDYYTLEHLLGLPVIATSARKSFGLGKLIELLTELELPPQKIVRYCPEIETKLSAIKEILDLNDKRYNRFVLVRILEGDLSTISSLNLNLGDLNKIDKIRGMDTDYMSHINEERHRICEYIYKSVVTKTCRRDYVQLTHKVDKLFIGYFTAFPLFFSIMFLVFFVSFGPFGSVCHDLTKKLVSWGIEYPVTLLVSQFNFNVVLASFSLALVGGISDVISFLPQILLLLGSIGVLEDTGYMARAAFIMDKVMRKMGLSGKAFVPLLMGFGCSVPAILSTRILRTDQERRLTVYLIPFMSCGAKIPVYLMFLNTFFPNCKFVMMFLIYLLGVLVSILFSFVFRKINKIEDNPMILEMPDYKIPSLKDSCLRLLEHCKDFLGRVGVVILGSSVVIWFMQSFDFSFNFVEDSSKSILASFGNLVAPIFSWSGFGNWKSAVALITGLIAKEAIISTMSVIYRSDNMALSDALLANFSKSSALAMIVFILLYPPCISAFAAFRKEAGTASACVSFIINLFIALIFSILTFVVSSFLFNVF